uniref:(northern house mosquito) hypothetical protein n=1 Tax=Culex pipiens TaxID=7175 RepID=A0A8D8CBN1_CULPI
MACSNNTNLTKLDDSSSMLPHHSTCLLLLLMLFFRATGKPKQAIFTHIAPRTCCDEGYTSATDGTWHKSRSMPHAHTLTGTRYLTQTHPRTLLPDRSSHRRRRTHSLFLVLASSAHTLQSKASREQVSGGRVCLLCVEKDTLFAEKVGTGSAGRSTRKLLAPWCGFQRQCPAPD